MTFRKLALASAVALAPTAGFAGMVELEDSTMSEVSGQDGISLAITTPAITTNVYIHDKDGLAGGAGAWSNYSFDGAIVINSFVYAGGLNITVDAGDSTQAGANPTLNINVTIPTATISTGDIRVANSQRDDATPGWGINTTSGNLLNAMTIVLSNLVMNIQLGNEPQGDMIRISSVLAGGVTINSFRLNDAGGALSGGGIGASIIQVRDTTGTTNTLTIGNIGVNATNAGLVIGINSLGTAGIDLRITDARVGTSTNAAIGDISIVGLNLNGTSVTLSGK